MPRLGLRCALWIAIAVAVAVDLALGLILAKLGIKLLTALLVLALVAFGNGQQRGRGTISDFGSIYWRSLIYLLKILVKALGWPVREVSWPVLSASPTNVLKPVHTPKHR